MLRFAAHCATVTRLRFTTRLRLASRVRFTRLALARRSLVQSAGRYAAQRRATAEAAASLIYLARYGGPFQCLDRGPELLRRNRLANLSAILSNRLDIGENHCGAMAQHLAYLSIEQVRESVFSGLGQRPGIYFLIVSAAGLAAAIGGLALASHFAAISLLFPPQCRPRLRSVTEAI